MAWAELDELEAGVEDAGANVVEVVALADADVALEDADVRPVDEAADPPLVAAAEVDLVVDEAATAAVVW